MATQSEMGKWDQLSHLTARKGGERGATQTGAPAQLEVTHGEKRVAVQETGADSKRNAYHTMASGKVAWSRWVISALRQHPAPVDSWGS